MHRSRLLLATLFILSLTALARAEDAKPAVPAKAPFNYIQAKAYHIPPETTTEESGYFSLCEGKDGKIYVGCAAYGRNSYLVEFDPATEKMRIVVDTHKIVGLPDAPTGYAAQSKIHTRNFVGPSGKIYVGTKQGYPTAAEHEMLKRGEKIPVYKGGYVIVYDPATGKSENLGMPMPLGDSRLGPNETEGQGVIDVVADEPRGLLYVVTCEDQRWMVLDLNHKETGYHELKEGLALRDQPNTLIDKSGRATAITVDYKIARYDPATKQVAVDDFLVDGKPMMDVVTNKVQHPDWRLAADGVTAYLQMYNDLRTFEVDLSGPAGQPVKAKNLGNKLAGSNPDTRGSISIAPDGRVYSVIGIQNETGFMKEPSHLFHVVRYDPKTKGPMQDLGVLGVKNPDFFAFTGEQAKNPDGSLRPRHGYTTLPDGTMTPRYVVLAAIVTRDGGIYATTLYPFTLLRIDAGQLK